MRISGLANMDAASTGDLRRKAKLRLLQMHYESGVGHLGGNLSALDILLCLYHFTLHKDDLFVLSKGHGAGALYVALWSIGALTDDDLRQFHQDGTRLSGHPPAVGIPEIIFATGSLGHGLGLACGLALGKKLKGEAGRVFCLTSDGEWNEGSCWESLIFLTHHRLDNLTMIHQVASVDLQDFGTTSLFDIGPTWNHCQKNSAPSEWTCSRLMGTLIRTSMPPNQSSSNPSSCGLSRKKPTKDCRVMLLAGRGRSVCCYPAS